MSYSRDGLYVYEDGGETIIEIPDPNEYRNARPRPGDPRAGLRRREHRATGGVSQSRRVVIRRPDADGVRVQPYPDTMPPVIVEQPVIDRSPEYGVSIGGMQLSLGTIAGTLLTLGGLGTQLASHFVDVPEPPSMTADGVIEDLVQYNQRKHAADRKLRLLETIGRTLSDVGQLAAFRK